MGRKLVVCLDGTDNQYAATNTNVVKIYAMIDRSKDDQIGYYQTGIGTFPPPAMRDRVKSWFNEKLDLAIAFLLDEHVLGAYRYLMRYYEEGDEIFIFGFSRGAYTARVLAAMLHKVGLLSAGNEELIPFAWDKFAKEFNESVYVGFRHTFARKVEVKFLGLWDTVSSVGWIWDPKHYQFTAFNPSVKIFRHAVALDERRTKFVQNLWTSKPPAGQDVLEVWFPGVHCDVGGGYPEETAGLSKVALQWMMKEAQGAGLRFQPQAVAQYLPAQDVTTPPRSAAPNPLAAKHESLTGFWWLAEIVPKHVKEAANNFEPRWVVPFGRHRHVNEGANLHESIFVRKNKDPAYTPPNIPVRYATIPWP